MSALERLRLAKGLSQKRLAELLGLDQSTVSRWESGQFRPEAETFPKLAEVLGITPVEVTHLFAPERAVPAV